MNNYEKNKQIFYIYTILTGKMFVGTTQVLFLTNKGFSLTEIMLISTITGISSLVLEIPTGMLADRVGYKKCISMGLAIDLIAYVFILLSNQYWHIVVYAILISMGEATISGADYSLLYESFLILKQEKKFKDYLRKVNSKKMYVVAVLTILSGFLYNLNKYIPFAITILLYAMAFLLSFFYTDIRSNKENIVHIKDNVIFSISSIKKNKKFQLYIIEGACFTVLFLNQNILLQEYMNDIGINVSLFGIVFFGYNCISAFISKRSGMLEKKLGNGTKVVLTLLIVVSFIIAGICANVIGIFVLSLCRVSIATINPMLDSQVNECINGGNRATLLSIYSASNSVMDSIFSPLIGMGVDKYGIFETYIILGGFFVFFVLFLFMEQIKKM